MAQYKIKLRHVNAIVGIDIEVTGNNVKAMVIAFRDDKGDIHTLEVDGSIAVYHEASTKLARELDVVRNHLSK